MSTVQQISTRYWSNHHGAGRITATVRTAPGKRRQLTLPYDHAARDPHMMTARALANKLGLPSSAVTDPDAMGNGGRIFHLTTV